MSAGARGAPARAAAPRARRERAARGAGPALLAALALCPAAASAAVQVDLTPSVVVGAGGDDNVRFDGLGGDAVGRATLKLDTALRDHRWSAGVELAPTVLGFARAGDWALLGEASGRARLRATPRTEVGLRARARAADDPLSAAQVGLGTAPGRTVGYRGSLFLDHRATRRWRLRAELAGNGVRIPKVAGYEARSGDAVGATLGARYRLTRPWELGASLQGRLFTGESLRQAVDLAPGLRWRPARRTFLELAGGPLLYRDEQGVLPGWAGRMRFTREGRGHAVELSAAHDLSVPSSRGGAVAMDMAEVVGRRWTGSLELRLRAGVYSGHPQPRSEQRVTALGAEAAGFWRVGGDVWLGLSAMRFQQMAGPTWPAMARDAVYGWVQFTPARP